MEKRIDDLMDKRIDDLTEQLPDELKHFGVPGMKWGVRRNLRKAGYSERQIKRLNKEYKREHEFEYRSGKLNKRAAKLVRKGTIGIQADESRLNSFRTSRHGFFGRKTIFSTVPRKKIEKALKIKMEDLDWRTRRQAKKLVRTYKNVNLRIVNTNNITSPTRGWKTI